MSQNQFHARVTELEDQGMPFEAAVARVAYLASHPEHSFSYSTDWATGRTIVRSA